MMEIASEKYINSILDLIYVWLVAMWELFPLILWSKYAYYVLSLVEVNSKSTANISIMFFSFDSWIVSFLGLMVFIS